MQNVTFCLLLRCSRWIVKCALMDSLSALLERVRNGDKDAFGEVYQIFYRKIYRYCWIHTSDAQLAQDICQETFIRAWKAMPYFSEKNGGTIQAFLFKIARNQLIDNSRKKKESRLADYQDLEDFNSLEDRIDRDDAINKVRKAVGKLNEIERQIITLHYFEDLSGEEIAQVVGMKEGAVRVRTYRILDKLKEILKEEK